MKRCFSKSETIQSGFEAGGSDEVVGWDAASAPGSGAFDPGEVATGPALLSFEACDASDGSDAPSDLFSGLGGVGLDSADLQIWSGTGCESTHPYSDAVLSGGRSTG